MSFILACLMWCKLSEDDLDTKDDIHEHNTLVRADVSVPRVRLANSVVSCRYMPFTLTTVSRDTQECCKICCLRERLR